MSQEKRPWGYFMVLCDDPTHKVKKIVVHSNKRLSLQRHQKRQEHWYVVEGEAQVTLEDKQITIKRGEYIDIPKKAKHRVFNPKDEELVFIEVQTGEYFGEDDIERFEDDFGRA